MFFWVTISDFSLIFGLLTFFGLVAIFDEVTTLGSATIGIFSITILGVLIMFSVALTLKLFYTKAIRYPFWSIFIFILILFF